MNLRRLGAGLLALSLLAAAACGSDDDDPKTDGAAAEEPASDDGDDAVVDDSPRTVEHAMGSTEVPASPQRVVALDSSFLDATLALGVTPVGASEAQAGEGMPPYLADRLADVEVVGLITEPNLEAVAALQPDLILGAKVRHEALYDQLSAIAPTVFTESSGTNWKDGLAVTADALGRTDEAEALLADYEARAAEVGAAVGADGKTASVVRFLLPEQIRLYGPETFSGTVLTDVGFDLGDHAWNEYSMFLVSAEQLGLADADVVFSTYYGGDGEPGDLAAGFPAEQALWEQVPAVAEGRAHWVADREWMLGIGLIGANLILDDVEALAG